MRATAVRKSLILKHPFTIARGTKTENTSIFVQICHNGLIGWGEASPNVRFGESPERTMNNLALMIDALPIDQARPAYRNLLAAFRKLAPDNLSAVAAMDMALMDYMGKSLGAPLYEIWGLDPTNVAPTSMTIGMDTPEVMAGKAREASEFHALKVKLGGADDRAMISAIRKVSQQAIRVDANEGWTDREKALSDIEWLAKHGVELVEQPMPEAQLDDMAWLKQRSPLPLIADEAFTEAAGLPRLAEAYHGINIKLQKCGGTQAALDAISLAKSMGMKIMIGCMVESALAIAAACHLSPLADYLDLDGHMLINNNPFDGLRFENGRVLVGDGPGLGVTPNPELIPPEDQELMAMIRREN